jgi:hypothetical protein
VRREMTVVSDVRVRRHIDGRFAVWIRPMHWIIANPARSHLTGWLNPIATDEEVSAEGWSELLVAELPEPDGCEGGWLLSNGVDLTAEPGGVSFDGDDPVPLDVWRADALKMLAAVAACERHRAGVKS